MSELPWTQTQTLPSAAEVVVLGGGLAGCAAALAAAEAGREVLLLEKRAEIGGSTVLSAGLSAFADTVEQREQGITDSVELLRQDLLETSRHLADPAMVDAYCAAQGDTYRWLKSHGITYGTVHAASGQSVPRSHPTDTTVLLHTLLKRAGELGARLATEVRALRLTTSADGRVNGLLVRTPEGSRQLRAGAVVLATGGFSRSPELLARFAPQMERALRGGGEANEGDGLRMGWKLGAGLADTPHIKGTYGILPEPDPRERGTGILAVYKGAIAVNAQGKRFVDESRPYKEIGDASLAQPGGVTHQIFDATVMAASDSEVPIYDFAAREKSGVLLSAPTLQALAERVGLPPAQLRDTVERYNQAATAQAPDEFGRERLSGGYGDRVPLVAPPFYAQPSSTVLLATYCGLTVRPDGAVLDVFGDPIPGLFAAGEVTGGFHGGGYMTGTSIGKAAVFGRAAGLSAGDQAEEQHDGGTR